MAIKPSSSKKPSRPAEPVAVDEDAEQPQDIATDESAEATAPEIAVERPKPVAPQSQGEISTRVDVSKMESTDDVVITMHETISPAPRVGAYSVGERLGLKELKERKNYRLPLFVAQVIVDAGKGEYLQVD